MDQIKVGVFISQQRKKQQITQSELANALFVSEQAVSKWERGLNYPDIALLFRLADLLKVSVSEILQGELSVSEIKTEEAVKEVLEYSSTLINREKKSFSKRIMILRLVIVLIIAGFINFYFQVRSPQISMSPFTSSDTLWLNYQFRDVQLLSTWDYCGNINDIQLFAISQKSFFEDKSKVGYAIKFPTRLDASIEKSMVCPALVEVNLSNSNTLDSLSVNKGGKALWTSQRQVKQTETTPILSSTIDGSSLVIDYTIYNKSTNDTQLELYTRFSMTVSGYTINGSTALTTIELNKDLVIVNQIPKTYLDALEKGLLSFILKVEDSQKLKVRLDGNTNDLIIGTSAISSINFNFVETRTVEVENFRWIIKQVYTYGESKLTFRRTIQDGMNSLDIEGPSRDNNLFFLKMILNNQLNQWPVPDDLSQSILTQLEESTPWTIEGLVSVYCIEPSQHYRITWQ